MSVSAVRIPATKTAKNAVIFLHGLGDTGEGWSWFPQVISQTGILKSQAETNFIFPNAPSIPITVNGGMRMPGWFDIYEFGNPKAKQDVDGFFKTCDLLKSLIKEQHEKHNIPLSKIVIGGFSQGAAISIATLSLLEEKIGGAVALSGFCPVSDALKSKIQNANFETPVFQGHGDVDPIVQHSFGEDTSKFYREAGFKDWTFKTYGGVAHSANDEELVDVIKFLSLILDK